MSDDLKRRLLNSASAAHVREFGNCVGIVVGKVDYNNCPTTNPRWDPKKVGPEIDVRWLPSNLRYAYKPDDLVVLRSGA